MLKISLLWLLLDYTIIPIIGYTIICLYISKEVSEDPACKTSVKMLSVPGAFPDFVGCMACVNSCSVGLLLLYPYHHLVWGGGGSAVMVTDDLFRTSESARHIS